MMRPTAITSAFCVALSFVGSPIHAQQMSGRVIDAQGGPVGGALVLFSPGDMSAKTDPKGAFAVDGLADGNYTVSVTVGGAARQVRTAAVVVAGGRMKPPAITIEPLEHSVSGEVRNRDNAKLAGVNVTFKGPKNVTVTTDAEGMFYFTGPPGNYVIVVQSGGNSSQFKATISDQKLNPSRLSVDWGQ